MSKTGDTLSDDIIESYIHRELLKPKTTWITPALIFMLILVIPYCVGYTLVQITRINTALCYTLCYIIIDIVLLRILLIKLIRCYQHYASEDLRRFCMCVPSCSEYAIAVLKKYLFVIAIYKIIYRLVVTCDGEKKIDMP